MYRFFMQRRYVELFFMLRKHKTIKDLSRQSGMTISHLSAVTDQWRKEGLIQKNKKGRESDITITKKGEELFALLEKWDALAKKEIKPGEENEGKNQVVPSS